MWCYDCDACFCADCHAKPHVLVLGSKPAPPHNVFPVEGMIDARSIYGIAVFDIDDSSLRLQRQDAEPSFLVGGLCFHGQEHPWPAAEREEEERCCDASGKAAGSL